jgi:hypothetical protein
MPNYGTMMIADLLAQTSGTVAQIDRQMIWETFRRSLAAHNTQMMDMVSTFCDPTTDRLIGTGGIQAGDFEEMDELETPRPQKVAPGENLGIPMRNYAFGQQWTNLYLMEASPADLAGQFLAVMDADKRNVINQINRAIYLSSNYTSVDIRKKDQASLPVKRLANADSFSIPVGPNGETFTASTHTHYLARVSTFASTDLDALISTVAEHYVGNVMVAINQAQETAVRAFTGFTATVDARIIQATTGAYAGVPDLDVTNRGDRLIGYYNGASIWVKPWAVANYLLAWNTGAPKACSFRTRSGSDDPNSGLRPAYDSPATEGSYPLNVKGWEREFGVACTGRVSAAVLYVGATSYADPTLANY